MLLGITLAVFVVIADQLSKFCVLHYLMEGRYKVEITPFFNLVSAWNTGVSFSMFHNQGAIILSVVALTIVTFLLYWLYKEPDKLMQIGLGFIIGGACGNVIDRIRLSAVYDFLDFHIMGYHWPAFNVADSFICIGATIIIIQGLLEYKNKKEEVK